jgi:dTDP-4-amino-4,6-dideoxygalactose transaminase
MIPFLDLEAQYETIKDEIDEAIRRVLVSAQYVLGPEVRAFEDEFAAFCGADFAVGVNSGTSALHLALLAAGIGPGDEVITVSYTFVATVAAILYTGARPVLVDIDPDTFTMDTDQIAAAITPHTRAILPVHLYGHPADMRPIHDLALQHGLVVIEDAAQAHGAADHGRRVGSIGDLACFSFYPSKNLGAYGEAGAVTTSHPEFAQKLRLLRDWGAARKYEYTLRGFNYRLDAIQAAILRVKLRHLAAWNEGRRAVARRYDDLLRGSAVQTPVTRPGAHHVYHIYAIRAPRRDDLLTALAEQGITARVHYAIPIHAQPSYRDLVRCAAPLPHTETCARAVLSLPVYAEMTPAMVETVAAAIRRFY